MQALDLLIALFMTGLGIACVRFREYFSSKSAPDTVGKDRKRLLTFGEVLLVAGVADLILHLLAFAP